MSMMVRKAFTKSIGVGDMKRLVLILGFMLVASVGYGIPIVQQLTPSSGSWSAPVATVFGNIPISTDQISFGSIKSLYR